MATATATRPVYTKPNPTTESEFMDLRELAERSGISMTTAYELARSDMLPVPAIRFGRQFRFSRRAYDDLTRSQHTASRVG